MYTLVQLNLASQSLKLILTGKNTSRHRVCLFIKPTHIVLVKKKSATLTRLTLAAPRYWDMMEHIWVRSIQLSGQWLLRWREQIFHSLCQPLGLYGFCGTARRPRRWFWTCGHRCSGPLLSYIAMKLSKPPSINPSIFSRLSRAGSRGQQPEQSKPHQRHFIYFHRGDAAFNI